jgi:hypothetical protein
VEDDEFASLWTTRGPSAYTSVDLAHSTFTILSELCHSGPRVVKAR